MSSTNGENKFLWKKPYLYLTHRVKIFFQKMHKSQLPSCKRSGETLRYIIISVTIVSLHSIFSQLVLTETCLASNHRSVWKTREETWIKRSDLGTGQYLWEYGTGKFATGPRIILVLQLAGASVYFEGWLYRATAYCSVRSQRGQRLFWSNPRRDHILY